jgi:putative copper export protein
VTLLHHAAPSGLAPALTIVRLGLHVLSAAVWVGGQFVLAGLVPAARRIGPDAPRTLARAFARLSWPAYAVLVGTGVWNVSTFHVGSQSTAWQVVLGVKIAVVALAGVAAFAHAKSTSRRGLAVWGALSALSSVAALFIGIALAG